MIFLLKIIKEKIKHNYQNEMTPQTHWFVGSRVILELFYIYKLTSRNAWTRYFLNEVHTVTNETINEELFGKNENSFDLRDDEHWSRFMEAAKTYNEDFPGYFAPKGEEIDYEHLRKLLIGHLEEVNFDRLDAADMNFLGVQLKMSQKPFIATEYENENHKGHSDLGADLPKHLRKSDARGLF